MPSVKINITEEDIRNGIRRDCNSCPVALAIFRLVKLDTYIKVGPKAILLEREGRSVGLELPRKPELFIRSYDNGSQLDFDPFFFVLEIPEEYLCQPLMYK